MFSLTEQIVAANAQGIVRGAGGRGRKIVVFPAGPTPGALPVQARLNGGDRGQVDIAQGGVLDLGKGNEFDSFELYNCTPNGTYFCMALPEGANWLGTGAKTQAVANVATVGGVAGEQAMATVAPAAGANAAIPATALQVFPSWLGQNWNLNLSGSVQTVDIWYRDLAGRWHHVEQIPAADWDATSITDVVSRTVQFGGGYLYFQAGAGGVVFSFDAGFVIGG